MGRTRVLGGILCFALVQNAVQALQSVSLAWDPSTDRTVVGYRIYYGVASSAATNAVDIGNATSVSIPGLIEGMTYFFAATAYDALEQESRFSNVLSYTVPAALAKLKIRVTANGQVVLTLAGQGGHTYDLLATQGFAVWTVIGTVTLGTTGSLEFVDLIAANLPARFYRMREKP